MDAGICALAVLGANPAPAGQRAQAAPVRPFGHIALSPCREDFVPQRIVIDERRGLFWF
jgi:hypothetical protein